MSSSLGQFIKLTLFGESHGESVGCVIDGLPPGLTIDFTHVDTRLNQRRPGNHGLTSQRTETDQYHISSGLYQGKTTGTPLMVSFPNADRRSADYDQIKRVYRPGHADYTGQVKYKGANDPRGGGHFSARLTAPIVFAGAIAEQLLNERNIHIAGHILSIGKAKSQSLSEFSGYDETLEALDKAPCNLLHGHAEKLLAEVEKAKQNKDSVGAVVEAAVFGLPVGLGAPFFDTVESRLSYALFAIPAVKGVSFGDGFDYSKKRGSEVVDAFVLDHQGNVKTNANHNGGVNGGITNGMPLLFKCAFKPTASITGKMETLDFESGEMTTLEIEGRHDPCVALRAVPVVKSIAALVILDMMLESHLIE